MTFVFCSSVPSDRKETTHAETTSDFTIVIVKLTVKFLYRLVFKRVSYLLHSIGFSNLW